MKTFCVVIFFLTAALYAVGSLSFSVKQSVINDVEREYGPSASDRVRSWVKRVNDDAKLVKYHEMDVLKNANDFFNQLEWLSDMSLWKVEDYWSTPVEMLAKNAGDCEDYSVSKYFSLEGSQFDIRKLRITYVKSLEYEQAHMVLTYYETPGSEPLILDNINKRILPASKRTDLLPIYSFDMQNIWLAKSRNSKLNAESMKSLPNWKRVNERFRAQMD